MESDRIALCGTKGVADPRRRTVRGGSKASQVVLSGQRIAVRRSRANSLTDGELSLPSFEGAASCDLLDAATMALRRIGLVVSCAFARADWGSIRQTPRGTSSIPNRVSDQVAVNTP
jgi:hypothetical protein